MTEKADTQLIREILSPTRLLIMLELAAGEKSLTELARNLRLSASTIHYHITKLVKLGLIKVSRIEHRGNLTVKYYGVTDELNIISDKEHLKKAPERMIIPYIIAFLAKVLERSVKPKKASGYVKLLILNVDREHTARITEEINRVVNLASDLGRKSRSNDTVMLLSIIAVTQPRREQPGEGQ